MTTKVKVIIVEGTDNTGKDTLIKSISSKFDVVKIYHCQKPKNTDPIYAALEQKYGFEQIIENIKLDIENNLVDNFAIILNRSWYGEYVYGLLYRGNGHQYVCDMIKYMDNMLLNITDEVSFITLLSSSTDLSVKNDDGLSIRNDADSIARERLHFIKANEISIVPNKKIIYVNDKNDFRKPEDILEEACEVIYNVKEVELEEL